MKSVFIHRAKRNHTRLYHRYGARRYNSLVKHTALLHRIFWIHFTHTIFTERNQMTYFLLSRFPFLISVRAYVFCFMECIPCVMYESIFPFSLTECYLLSIHFLLGTFYLVLYPNIFFIHVDDTIPIQMFNIYIYIYIYIYRERERERERFSSEI